MPTHDRGAGVEQEQLALSGPVVFSDVMELFAHLGERAEAREPVAVSSWEVCCRRHEDHTFVVRHGRRWQFGELVDGSWERCQINWYVDE